MDCPIDDWCLCRTGYEGGGKVGVSTTGFQRLGSESGS